MSCGQTSVKFQLRRGTAQQWSTANPILAQGEPGYDETNNLLKIGDGITPWNSLPAIASSGGGTTGSTGPTGSTGSTGSTGPTGPTGPSMQVDVLGPTGQTASALAYQSGPTAYTTTLIQFVRGVEHEVGVSATGGLLGGLGTTGGATGLSSDDYIQVSGDIIPTRDGVFNLGAPNNKFKSAYIGANTVYIGDVQISSNSNGIANIFSRTSYRSALPSGDVGENFMVCLGSDTANPNNIFNSILISNSATQWYTVDAGSTQFGSLSGFGVAWNGAIWVATGNDLNKDTTILVSTTGHSWQAVPNLRSMNLFDTGYGVAWSGKNWIVGGANQATGVPTYVNQTLAYSTDNAITWSFATIQGVSGEGVGGQVATDGNGRCVASGVWDTYSSLISYDHGQTWVPTNPTFTEGANGVAYNGKLWVMCGANSPEIGQFVYSTDGVNWNSDTVLYDVSGNIYTSTSARAQRVAWNGMYWIAVGQLFPYGNVLKSYDGVRWQSIIGTNGLQARDITWNGASWVMTGYDIGAILIGTDNGAGGIYVVSNPVEPDTLYPQNLSMLISYDGDNWFSINGTQFTSSGYGIASRRVLPYTGLNISAASGVSPTGPTGPTGPASTAVGPTGPTGPASSIMFDGGTPTSVYTVGPVFDCGTIV